MAGRPTKLTPERESDLVLLLSNGVSVKAAARAVGVDSKRVAADHYVYALTDYREAKRSIALAGVRA